MNLVQLLEEKKDEVVEISTNALRESCLRHYQEVGTERCRYRYKRFFHFVLKSIKENNLMDIINYVRNVARERFRSGYDIQEVQIAFNILEEAMWHCIMKDIKKIKPSELGKFLELISTVCGVGKDFLSDTYVFLSNKTRAPVLDVPALFAGTDGV